MSDKKIRLIRTMVTEYEPVVSSYPEGYTIEQMAEMDANADDPEMIFEEVTVDNIQYEIIDGKDAVAYQVDAVPDYLNDEKSTDTMKHLYDTSKKFGSTDAHFTANMIFKDEKATGVVSVYDGIKPAHMVLGEIKEYAEKNSHPLLLQLIEKYENDISFLNRQGNITPPEEE